MYIVFHIISIATCTPVHDINIYVYVTADT